MELYKDFIQRLRKQELNDVYLILVDDVTQKLKEYVLLLNNVEFVDGLYHTFYGAVKRIIASFVFFYATIADEVTKQVETYKIKIDKAELIWLAERTKSIHQANQDDFRNSFLPANTPLEKQIYEEIEMKYEEYTKRLSNFTETMNKLDSRKQNQIDDFAKINIPISFKETKEIFNMVHDFLAMMLVDNIKKIRLSLDVIYYRIKANLQKAHEDNEDAYNNLLNQLYEKNKELMIATRSKIENSVALAEARHSVDNIKKKLENFEVDDSIARLKNELEYWNLKLENFNNIAENLTKLKIEEDKVFQSEKIYETMKAIAREQETKFNLTLQELKSYKELCTQLENEQRIITLEKELCDARKLCSGYSCEMKCKKRLGASFNRKKVEIAQLIKDETKALITFFFVNGSNRIIYTDNIGPYFVDEFNHQVYVFDYGLGIYHVNCEGEFEEFPDYIYYFDRFGRHFKDDDGEKVYQCAPCTSHYKLRDNQLFKKVTKDCGHSEKVTRKCRMQIYDHTKLEILPDVDPIDIKHTLDKETVTYLWKSFGAVLPEALRDVGKTRPKNPIHYLAHKLLYHKYRRTKDELRQKKEEAEQYRLNIVKKRKEQAIEASKQWKSKQVKPRKPEESDDTDVRTFNAKHAEQMFINSLYYLNN